MVRGADEGGWGSGGGAFSEGVGVSGEGFRGGGIRLSGGTHLWILLHCCGRPSAMLLPSTLTES